PSANMNNLENRKQPIERGPDGVINTLRPATAAHHKQYRFLSGEPGHLQSFVPIPLKQFITNDSSDIFCLFFCHILSGLGKSIENFFGKGYVYIIRHSRSTVGSMEKSRNTPLFASKTRVIR